MIFVLFTFSVACLSFCNGNAVEQENQHVLTPTWDEDQWLLSISAEMIEFPCNHTFLPKDYCVHYLEDVLKKEAAALQNNTRSYLSLKVPYSIEITYRDEKATHQFSLSQGEDEMKEFCEAENLSEETCGVLFSEYRLVSSRVASAHESRIGHLRGLLSEYETNQVPLKGDVAEHPLFLVVKEMHEHAKRILEHDQTSVDALNALTSLYKYALGSEEMAKMLEMYDGLEIGNKVIPLFEKLAQLVGSDFLENECSCSVMPRTPRGNPCIVHCEPCVLNELNSTVALQLADIYSNLARTQVHLGHFEDSKPVLATAWGIYRSLLKGDNLKETKTTKEKLSVVLEAHLTQATNNRDLDNAMCYIHEIALNKEEPQLLEILVFKELFRATTVPFVFESQEELEYNLQMSDMSLARLNALRPVIRNLVSPEYHLKGLPTGNYYALYTELGDSKDRLVKQMQRRVQLVRVLRDLEPALSFEAEHIREAREMVGANKDERIHVGIVSSFLYSHSIGKLLCSGIYQLLNRFPNAYRFSVLNVGSGPHFQTRANECATLHQLLFDSPHHQLLSLPFETHDDAILKLQETQALIAALRLDILIFGEIGLSGASYYLAFSRLAQVQIGFWGHALTTGIENTVDYMIIPRMFFSEKDAALHFDTKGIVQQSVEDAVALSSSIKEDLETVGELLEPDFPLCTGEFEDHIPFVEGVLCTESLLSYFEPLHITSDVTSHALKHLQEAFEEIGIREVALDEYNLYYLPHKMMKMHVSFDKPLIEILMRDPKAVLVTSQGDANSPGFSTFAQSRVIFEGRIKSGLKRAIELVGAAPHLSENRIVWFGPVTKEEYSAISQLCNVVLDVAPISAGVTALEILSVGSPIVSIPSLISTGPSVCGMYKKMEVDRGHLCAHSMQEYVELALEIGTNRSVESRLRATLIKPEVQSRIFEDPNVATEWNAVLLGALKRARTQTIPSVGRYNARSQHVAPDEYLAELPKTKKVYSVTASERIQREAVEGNQLFRPVRALFLPGPAYV